MVQSSSVRAVCSRTAATRALSRAPTHTKTLRVQPLRWSAVCFLWVAHKVRHENHVLRLLNTLPDVARVQGEQLHPHAHRYGGLGCHDSQLQLEQQKCAPPASMHCDFILRACPDLFALEMWKRMCML